MPRILGTVRKPREKANTGVLHFVQDDGRKTNSSKNALMGISNGF
jgi:hypothetical protein